MELVSDLFHHSNELSDQISNPDRGNKLFDQIASRDYALMVFRANSRESNKERRVACLSKSLPGHKYMFFIRESTYSYEKSYGYCHACYEYRNTFDGKLKSEKFPKNSNFLLFFFFKKFMPSITIWVYVFLLLHSQILYLAQPTPKFCF